VSAYRQRRRLLTQGCPKSQPGLGPKVFRHSDDHNGAVPITVILIRIRNRPAPNDPAQVILTRNRVHHSTTAHQRSIANAVAVHVQLLSVRHAPAVVVAAVRTPRRVTLARADARRHESIAPCNSAHDRQQHSRSYHVQATEPTHGSHCGASKSCCACCACHPASGL
jgi:hypothetical protein